MTTDDQLAAIDALSKVSLYEIGTPTTTSVRMEYAYAGTPVVDPVPRSGAFDRWLERVKQEAWEAGYTTGFADKSKPLPGSRPEETK